MCSLRPVPCLVCAVFFFNDTATTEIYTLSLHDALPILLVDHELLRDGVQDLAVGGQRRRLRRLEHALDVLDRKSTRLNSSHSQISYAVFCLKKKKTQSSNSISSAQNNRSVRATSIYIIV